MKRRRRWRFVFTLARIAMRPSNVCGKSRKDLIPFILQIGENSINQTFKILIRSTCKKKSSDSISYILQTSTSLDSTSFILLVRQSWYSITSVTNITILKRFIFYICSRSLEVSDIVREYQARIIEEASNGYDGNDIPKYKWTFSGSLLYSITVITTIG